MGKINNNKTTQNNLKTNQADGGESSTKKSSETHGKLGARKVSLIEPEANKVNVNDDNKVDTQGAVATKYAHEVLPEHNDQLIIYKNVAHAVKASKQKQKLLIAKIPELNNLLCDTCLLKIILKENQDTLASLKQLRMKDKIKKLTDAEIERETDKLNTRQKAMILNYKQQAQDMFQKFQEYVHVFNLSANEIDANIKLRNKNIKTGLSNLEEIYTEKKDFLDNLKKQPQESKLTHIFKKIHVVTTFDNELKKDLTEKRQKISTLKNNTSLGKGSFGIVEMVDPAHQTFLTNDVGAKALQKFKVLKKQTAEKENQIYKLDFENRLHEVSNTPVKFIDSKVVENKHYTLMDWGGVSLDEFLFNNPLDKNSKNETKTSPKNNKALNHEKSHQNIVKGAIFAVATQILDLHEQGIAHKDLKPANIMINPSTGETAIIDFGLAELADSDNAFNEKTGTINYKAPEINLTSEFSNKVDVWSLGFVLAEALIPAIRSNVEIKKKRSAQRSKNLKSAQQIQKLKECITEVLALIKDKFGTVSLEHDIVSKMLVINDENRYSMKEVTQHPYFSSNEKSFFMLSQQHKIAMNELAKLEKSYKIIVNIVEKIDSDDEHFSKYEQEKNKALEKLEKKRAEVKQLQENMKQFKK